MPDMYNNPSSEPRPGAASSFGAASSGNDARVAGSNAGPAAGPAASTATGPAVSTATGPAIGVGTAFAGSVPYAYPPQRPRKQGKGWIVGLVAVVALFLLMLGGLVSCAAVVCTSVASLTSASDSDSVFTDGDAIAVIEIDGTIQYDGTSASPEGLKDLLDQAEANDSIRAVVLRIDSGGGTATAGEEMTAYLQKFSKPVVVSSASMNASAAYMISSQADYIFTAKSTSIGSIGTAMEFTDLSGLYELLGISIVDITSADSKDSTYGNRALTDDEIAYYQAMVDEINEMFIELVAEGRNMSIEDVRTLATGLCFTGTAAVKNGLADEIGTLEDALDKAAELAGVDGYSTVYLDTSSSLDVFDLLSLFSSTSTSSNSALVLKELQNNACITQ